VIPIAREGSFSGKNVVTCCAACNAAKGPLTYQEYLLLLMALNSIHPNAKRNVLARLKAGGKLVRRL
jgi:5-methylcytosine-specific restriction endonuclease McrA